MSIYRDSTFQRVCLIALKILTNKIDSVMKDKLGDPQELCDICLSYGMKNERRKFHCQTTVLHTHIFKHFISHIKDN